jgi:hypothetical protein
VGCKFWNVYGSASQRRRELLKCITETMAMVSPANDTPANDSAVRTDSHDRSHHARPHQPRWRDVDTVERIWQRRIV